MLTLTPYRDESVVLLLDPSIAPNTPVSELFAQGPVHANILGGFGSHVVVAIAAPKAIAYRLDLGSVTELAATEHYPTPQEYAYHGAIDTRLAQMTRSAYSG